MPLDSLQIQQLSTILEILSFFLVTIDLYGKERVTRLGNRISQLILWLISKLKPPNIVKTLGKTFSEFLETIINKDWISIFIAYLYVMLIYFAAIVLTNGISFWRRLPFLLITIAIFISIKTLSKYAQSKFGKDALDDIWLHAFMMPVGFVYYFLLVAMIIAIYLLEFLVVVVTVLILSLMTIIILPLARLLLEKMKLEGILVWLGAILFMISKLIPYLR